MSIYFKLPVSEKTQKKIKKVLKEIDKSDKPKAHSKELSDIINSLLDEGMDYYFISALKRLKVSPIVRRPFEMGINTSIKGLKIIAPKILKTLSEKQFEEAVEILKEMICKEKKDIKKELVN